MAFTCKGCGADLQVGAHDEVVRCEYCGATTRVREARPGPALGQAPLSGAPGQGPLAKEMPPVPVPSLAKKRSSSLVAVSMAVGIAILAGGVVMMVNRGGCTTFAEWYSSGCLVDANGDDVLDVAGWMGSPSDQNVLTVVDGITGKKIWSHGGEYASGSLVVCLDESHVGVARPDFAMEIFSSKDPDPAVTVQFTDQVSSYAVGDGCAMIVTQDGQKRGTSLSDGSQVECATIEPHLIWNNPGMSSASGIGYIVAYSVDEKLRVRRVDMPELEDVGYTDKGPNRIELRHGALTFVASARETGTPVLALSAKSNGKKLWNAPLRYTAVGGSNIGLVLAPGMLVTFGSLPGDTNGGVIVGIDPATGNVVYEKEQGSTWAGQASGMHYNGRHVIVYWGFGLHAYDPATGERVWHIGGR